MTQRRKHPRTKTTLPESISPMVPRIQAPSKAPCRGKVPNPRQVIRFQLGPSSLPNLPVHTPPLLHQVAALFYATRRPGSVASRHQTYRITTAHKFQSHRHGGPRRHNAQPTFQQEAAKWKRRSQLRQPEKHTAAHRNVVPQTIHDECT